MNFRFSLLLALLSFQSFSQKTDIDRLWSESSAFSIGNFSKDQLKNYATYVFADTLFVRERASLKSSIKDTLFAGDDLKIIEMAELLKIGNRIYPWFKIIYKDKNNVEKTGHAWGGLISPKALRRANTKFVYGIPKILANKENGYPISCTVEVKAIENQKIISKTTMQINGESASLSNAIILNNKGLENVSNVILLAYSGEACGIPSYYFYILWNGKTLTIAPKFETISDADVFFESYTLVFPTDKGGIKGKVVQEYDFEELIDEKTEKYKRKSSKTIYRWTGSEFLKE
jgi:hypothetical protein